MTSLRLNTLKSKTPEIIECAYYLNQKEKKSFKNFVLMLMVSIRRIMLFASWFLEIWSERSNFMVLGVRGCQMYLPFVFFVFFLG